MKAIYDAFSVSGSFDPWILKTNQNSTIPSGVTGKS